MKHPHGISLLETMLVLVIAVSLLTLGVRVFNQFQFQANEQRIAASVNQVFQAMNGYYYSKCRVALNSQSKAISDTTGSLDPLITDTSGTPLSVLVLSAGNLMFQGYLTNWMPYNTLLDNTTSDKGYYTQFNRILSGGKDDVMSVNACTGSTNPPSCDRIDNAILVDTSPAKPTEQSHVVMWVAQVAVKLSTKLTNAQIIQIKNDLNADCISNPSGSGVTPCTNNPSAAGYLVWTRPPSAYNSKITSDYWTSTPYVKEFNMQYTNDGMAALSGVTNETQNWYNALNYLCGG